jgi:hypothetical protein
MRHTRREFIEAISTSVPGLNWLAPLASQSRAPGNSDVAKPLSGNTPPIDTGNPQVSKMKFGGVEISRIVLGVNPLFGGSHYNPTFSSTMAEWYTQDRVLEVMRRACSFGINTCNYVTYGRVPGDWARFRVEGGSMHLIPQVKAKEDAAALVSNLKPLAMQRQGEEVDTAFMNRTLGDIREWCKRVRDLGVLVGVGTHKPEVIETIEEQGWDVDFYAGCVYNRTRTVSELKQVLGGELPEMPREIYIQSDPPRMYKVMRQTSKTCFAFKILAGGRIADADVPRAFRTAFESLKPNDGIYVGFFPKRKDRSARTSRSCTKFCAGRRDKSNHRSFGRRGDLRMTDR